MARTRSTNDEPPGPEMTAEERAELDARLAKMLTKPHKFQIGGNEHLMWSARDDNDSATMMMWNPETPEEIRAAEFFHDAAHGLGAFAKKVAKGKPFRRSAEEAALINAILADRADETGYLVYADYLTEKGDTQGDFIRLCVELAHLTPGDPGFDEKNAQQQELVDAHGEEWYKALGELGPRPDFYGRFVPWLWLSIAHGVIEEVVIDRPGLLPDHADRLFAAAPFLRKLEFAKGHADAGLARVKQLSQIEELEFSHADVTADVLAKILKSKYLTGLKALLLNGNEIGAAGARALTAWPGLAQLRTLDLGGCELGAEGVSHLALCPNVGRLEVLRLGRNAPDNLAVADLLASLHLKALRELDLGSAELAANAVPLFGRAAFAKTLRVLDLESCTLPDDGFAQLVQCALPALESLKLNSVRLRAQGAGHLAASPFAQTLTALALDNCELGTAGAEALFAGTFPKLTTLDLSRNRLMNRGGVALAGAAKRFPALTVLKLWDNKLGPDAVTALAGSKLLANVTELDLNGNKIGPAGALALARSKHLKNLKSLTVDEKTAGKKGKQALVDRFGDDVLNWR